MGASDQRDRERDAGAKGFPLPTAFGPSPTFPMLILYLINFRQYYFIRKLINKISGKVGVVSNIYIVLAQNILGLFNLRDIP